MQILRTAALAIFVVILDQLSKWWVMGMLWPDGMDGFQSRVVLPFFNLVTVWNKGISFGLLSNDTDYGPYILIAVSIAISIGFAFWAFRTVNTIHHICIALVIGGAIGNVIDRLRFGAVFDFLDVHAFGFHWPAFNIADSAIFIGVFILMIYTYFFEKPVKEAK